MSEKEASDPIPELRKKFNATWDAFMSCVEDDGGEVFPSTIGGLVIALVEDLDGEVHEDEVIAALLDQG
jgi:hypothetical protein